MPDPNGQEKKFSSMQEVYQFLAQEHPVEKINAACYVILQTVYLNDVNYKREFREAWHKRLGFNIPEVAFRHIRNVFRCFTDRTFIEIVKRDEPIHTRNILWFMIVNLELDLCLIERFEAKEDFTREFFRQTMDQKYFGAFNRITDKVEQVSIPFIKDFQALGRSLRPYRTLIKNMFERLNKTNADAINKEIERCKRNRQTDSSAASELEQCHEKIRHLESDVAEFQRQRDEQIEYAQTQYDRGIRDVFNLINDERYSKVLDYFYALMSDDKTEPNLRSYLENFFIAIEELDVVPIINDGKVPNVEPDRLSQMCTLNFDKKNFDPAKVKVISPGWRFKSVILDKPALSLEK